MYYCHGSECVCKCCGLRGPPSRHGYVKPVIRTRKKALRISARHLKSWFPKFCHVGSNNYISAAPEECVLVAQGK